jgi:prepilin-type N-terminal cleavage/methylation domain-containing protein
MMLHNRQKPSLGFTLIELAIVLAVVGLMTVGLWRLMSSSNQQSKDTATAGLHVQLINAAKSFLASSDGQAYLQSFCTVMCVSGTTVSLPLPSANTPAGGTSCYSPIAGDSNLNVAPFNTSPTIAQTWCMTLPKGFTASSTNPYGQTYSIRISYGTVAYLTPPTGAQGPPSAYSIMITTNGGDTIADTSGGRISSQIGGDGGFEYSTLVCGSAAANTACGAYGSWNSLITAAGTASPPGYGFGSDPGAGHVASQTYWSSESNTTGPWLARQVIDSSKSYNTITTGTSIYVNGNQITSGFNGSSALSDASNISLFTNTTTIPLFIQRDPATVNMLNSLIVLNSNCSTPLTTPTPTAGCNWAVQITGDATVSNILKTNVLYSNSDIRLKKNLRPVTNAVDDLMKLKPVYFTYKSNGAESMGLVAQDIEKVYPQLVSQGSKEDMKSVNYNGMIAPLVSAIQELERENEGLRQQLRLQELRQDKFEQTIKKSSAAD